MKKYIFILVLLALVGCSTANNQSKEKPAVPSANKINSETSTPSIASSTQKMTQEEMRGDMMDMNDKIDRVIKIRAERFKFTPNIIRVKKGEKVRFEVDNVDLLHDFFIPDLGLSNGDEFQADKPGEYPFICANFCGAGHSDMRGTIVVE